MSHSDELTPQNSLASTLVTMYEMKTPEDDIRAMAMRIWDAVDRHPTFFRDAAAEVAKLPTMPMESAEKTAAMEATRDSLGVTSAHESLEAALAARELLQRLDQEHGGQ
jgi:hypothetical protein